MEELIVTSAKYIKDSENNISIVKATIDGNEVFVAKDVKGNRHWNAIKKWVADGNTIDSAD